MGPDYLHEKRGRMGIGIRDVVVFRGARVVCVAIERCQVWHGVGLLQGNRMFGSEHFVSRMAM